MVYLKKKKKKEILKKKNKKTIGVSHSMDEPKDSVLSCIKQLFL